ncbi:MAG: secondary thiamine-phosphate synthase enzyme YjbQ [Candidatus Omnitrophica bacterium]|nr:secondary thiamine-phosphate synthase enzyme YjbQ [Candidatus Omnitrophota bacterium]
MKIITREIHLDTQGSPDLLDITDSIAGLLGKTRLNQGNVTVFVIGSTAGITSFEYEPGLIQDVQECYEKLIPSRRTYRHDAAWGDANGYSHLRASLTGPSLTIPFVNGKLLLGTWQQVVLAEFDNRPRRRRVVVQIIGEE